MTLSGSLDSPNYGAPPTPKLFGISLTPSVFGILLGLGGIGAAAFLFTQFVSPALQKMSELNTSIEQKETNLAQQEQTVRQVAEVVAKLDKAKAQNQEVRSLFSTQAALDTLLLDLNRLISQNGAKLLRFEPDYAASGSVSDSSVGPELNGKLKRNVTNVSFTGNFAQTLAILQRIDQLQTLLVIQNFTTEAKQPDLTRPDGPRETLLTSKFKLIAYVPLSPEESAPAAAVPAPGTPPGTPGAPAAPGTAAPPGVAPSPAAPAQ